MTINIRILPAVVFAYCAVSPELDKVWLVGILLNEKYLSRLGFKFLIVESNSHDVLFLVGNRMGGQSAPVGRLTACNS